MHTVMMYIFPMPNFKITPAAIPWLFHGSTPTHFLYLASMYMHDVASLPLQYDKVIPEVKMSMSAHHLGCNTHLSHSPKAPRLVPAPSLGPLTLEGMDSSIGGKNLSQKQTSKAIDNEGGGGPKCVTVELNGGPTKAPPPTFHPRPQLCAASSLSNHCFW